LFWKRKTPHPAVNAENGVAAGGDIRNSTINIGPNEERLRQIFQEELARIAQEKGVPPAPLQAVLLKLGEAGVPDHEIPARLDAAADELLDLRAQLARLRNDRPEFAAIRQQAVALIDRGELDAARAALARGRDAARAMREDMSRDEAEFLADEARIDHLQLAYPAAAAKYGEAASLVAPFDPAGAWSYLLIQANELSDQGGEFGDNPSLLAAIDLYCRALMLAPRERVPLDWAMTQNNLGNALSRLGGREAGTARLDEAVATFREALKEYTRERVPLHWARIQNNLGTALQTLGEREAGTARLDEAVAAYREALKEYTRERVPLDWAGSFGNQGVALMHLAERCNDAAMAEMALSQITTAYNTMREGGHAANAKYCEAQIPAARAVVERLRGP
jgi:tetratricopeptide (TPR) repeat protein